MFDLVRSSKDLDISLLPAITLACRQERDPVIRVNRAGEPSRRWRLVSQSAGGTDGSQTLRWRKRYSKRRSLAQNTSVSFPGKGEAKKGRRVGLEPSRLVGTDNSNRFGPPREPHDAERTSLREFLYPQIGRPLPRVFALAADTWPERVIAADLLHE